ncbi:MAG: ATP-binding protein, partial [Nitrospira sp.]|nr:ATP-binding protein [Nitrospira sp.]
VALRYTEDLLEITNPLFLKDRYLGGIRIGMSLEDEEDEIETLTRQLTQALVLISVITLGFTLILAVLWSKKISRPLIQMAHKAMKFSRGHLEERIEVQTTDEIGQLATTFNEMAESLSRTLKEKETALQAAHAFNQELKKAQIQLIQVERLSAVGLLTSGISHEINNPIGIILTTIGYILEELGPENPFYEDLKIIEGESLRCRKILRDLLTFTSGRETIKEQADLNQVVEEMVTLAGREKRVKSIHIQQVLCPDVPLVFIDVAQIKQVCLNLILNATDAMPEGGHLVISTGLAEGNGKRDVLVQFQDSGRGIAEKDLPRIFEPFFTTKDVGEGFGLGLSVSYGIVKSHGGQIKVTSEVGKGTTFYVYLPIDM